jgi:tyrosyl-tRNA synthetase
VTLYCGFDPTADSLHLGHLVPVLVLKRFQQAGHKPIALVGGATGMIGDPSFKATERKLNTPDVIAGWVDKIRGQVAPFLDFEGANAAIMANNYDWFGGDELLEFLRDIGKHFSVNAMIKKESVQQRLKREAGHLLHRVFLQPAAGLRLRRTQPPPRLHPADRRLRPVGQHRRRHRSDPPPQPATGLRPDPAAGHQGRRHQVRQDRIRRHLARCEEDLALRLLPVLAEHGRRRRLQVPALLHLPVGRRNRRHRSRRQGQRAEARSAAHPRRAGHRAGAWQGRAGSRAAHQHSLFSGDLESLTETISNNWRRTACPASRWRNRCQPDRRAGRRGLAKSKSEARGFLQSGSVAVNGAKVDALDHRC